MEGLVGDGKDLIEQDFAPRWGLASGAAQPLAWMAKARRLLNVTYGTRLAVLTMRDASSRQPPGPRASLEELDVASIANRMVDRFHEIEAVLAPIVGHRAVVALYERSMHLTSRTHAWLAQEGGGHSASMDLDSLRLLMMQQGPAAAAAAAADLQQSFLDLVSSLVGVSLTEKLLPPASPPQDLLNES